MRGSPELDAATFVIELKGGDFTGFMMATLGYADVMNQDELLWRLITIRM